METKSFFQFEIIIINPLPAGAAYIRVLFFISTWGTIF